MDNIIFHIDVNSAYLSWTAVERLSKNIGALSDTNAHDSEPIEKGIHLDAAVDLRTIPSIIGGDRKSRRGVVLAKSIPAKAYGIHTGEPVIHALKKCPSLTIIPPDHKLYSKYSQRLMALIGTFSPHIEKVSIDECYIDFRDRRLSKEGAIALAIKLKDHVYDTFGFTVNIGISSVKVLAKMASDFKKPNRVHTLFPDEIAEKMWPLPVSKLYMVGRAAAASLEKLEIKTIGDLAAADLPMIISHMKSHGKLIWEYANGIDPSIVQTESLDAKNIGHSTTLPQDITSSAEAKRILKSLSAQVSLRLKKSGQLASTVIIEIKYASFQTVSHQMKILTASCEEEIIYTASCRLFDELWNGDPIRLLGVRTAKLTKEAPAIQMNLFDLPKTLKEQRAEKAMEELHSKYGKHVLKKGF